MTIKNKIAIIAVLGLETELWIAALLSMEMIVLFWVELDAEVLVVDVFQTEDVLAAGVWIEPIVQLLVDRLV